MKKYIKWIMVLSIIIFVIDWGVMGLKILENNYDITIEAYVGLVSFLTFNACVIYRGFNDKCPHCGKLRWSKGKYCSYCGKEI